MDKVYELNIYDQGWGVALFTYMFKDRGAAEEAGKTEVEELKGNGFINATYSVVEYEVE